MSNENDAVAKLDQLIEHLEKQAKAADVTLTLVKDLKDSFTRMKGCGGTQPEGDCNPFT